MSKEKEYLELFYAEALGNQEEVSKLLTELEKKPTDSSLVNNIFRITHTLKGNASGMGLDKIASLSHILEDLFGEVRSGNLRLNKDIFTSLFKAVDVLGELIQSLKDDRKVSHRGIRTKLEVILRNNAKSKRDTEELPDEPTLEEGTIAGENIEAQEENGDHVKNEVDKAVSQISFSDIVQVPVKKLDNLLNLVGELIIERDRIISNHTSNGHSSNDYARLNRVSSDLQYSVMDVRLVQVGFLFNKFHRVVRDAANQERKSVSLKLEGTDTEIDRNILQIISDSLIHIIRNAVGHGIESASERKEKGKPEEGTIILKASNENEGVQIEIRDDGKGIDVEKVKKKAIDKQLVDRNLLKLMSKEEVFNLIFEPGFSTSDSVTAISGRGVGMDVVKKAVDSIGGSIEVASQEGEGTSIKLNLPASMAVKGTLLCELQNQTFAIPLSYTQSVVSLTSKEINQVGNGLVSDYLGKTISILFLKDILNGENLKKHRKNDNDHILKGSGKIDVVIVSHGSRTVGLIVDKLLQQKEIVEKPLMKPLDTIRLVSGVTILGNGMVCPVLNIVSLMQRVFTSSYSKNNLVTTETI